MLLLLCGTGVSVPKSRHWAVVMLWSDSGFVSSKLSSALCSVFWGITEEPYVERSVLIWIEITESYSLNCMHLLYCVLHNSYPIESLLWILWIKQYCCIHIRDLERIRSACVLVYIFLDRFEDICCDPKILHSTLRNAVIPGTLLSWSMISAVEFSRGRTQRHSYLLFTLSWTNVWL